MTSNTSHLVALQEGLSRERARLASARTERERESRRVWIAQREREIAGEMAFFGMADSAALPALSDDELLRELGA